jgi:hypothetical protein
LFRAGRLGVSRTSAILVGLHGVKPKPVFHKEKTMNPQMMASAMAIFSMLAKASKNDIRVYVWIFVIGPIILAALYVIYLIIAALSGFFGYRPGGEKEVNGNESSDRG